MKAHLGVNEILSTIMLNLVAVQLFNFLLRAPPMDPRQIEFGTRSPRQGACRRTRSSLTVTENVALGLSSSRPDLAGVRARIVELSEAYGLDVPPDAYLSQALWPGPGRAHTVKPAECRPPRDTYDRSPPTPRPRAAPR